MFTVSGRLFLADLVEGSARELASPGGGRRSRGWIPSAERIAYVVDGALHVREIEGGDRTLAGEDDPDVIVGARRVRRGRGDAPLPRPLVVAGRSDARGHPRRRTRRAHLAHRRRDGPGRALLARCAIPQAGTEDAVVTLHLFDVASGRRTDVPWDAAGFPYLARFDWSQGWPPLLLVVSRDQRRTQLLEIDPATGATSLVRETTDPEWVDLVADGATPRSRTAASSRSSPTERPTRTG